jgi:aminoglycoside 6-adenylyltransferase
MSNPTGEPAPIRRLREWAEAREDVRALLLTSSRASPHAPIDRFSDYDVILAVRDVRPYFADRRWLGDFGPVLAVYRDPIRRTEGFETFAYITQYEQGLKIDFMLWPVALLPRYAGAPALPEVLDVGYRVLLDKDRLTAGLAPPTYRAHIPDRPSAEEFTTVVEEFFHEATYVAKLLWRDELLPAKHSLDHMMKHDYLRRMLEWRIESDHDWSLKPGAYGKGLKKRLPPERWAALERTYAGAGLDDNWEALFRTIELFREVALEVTGRLGHAYPHELDRRVVDYLHWVRTLPRPDPGG